MFEGDPAGGAGRRGGAARAAAAGGRLPVPAAGSAGISGASRSSKTRPAEARQDCMRVSMPPIWPIGWLKSRLNWMKAWRPPMVMAPARTWSAPTTATAT